MLDYLLYKNTSFVAYKKWMRLAHFAYSQGAFKQSPTVLVVKVPNVEYVPNHQAIIFLEQPTPIDFIQKVLNHAKR